MKAKRFSEDQIILHRYASLSFLQKPDDLLLCSVNCLFFTSVSPSRNGLY
jgi:hypothetical protein